MPMSQWDALREQRERGKTTVVFPLLSNQTWVFGYFTMTFWPLTT